VTIRRKRRKTMLNWPNMLRRQMSKRKQASRRRKPQLLRPPKSLNRHLWLRKNLQKLQLQLLLKLPSLRSQRSKKSQQKRLLRRSLRLLRLKLHWLMPPLKLMTVLSKPRRILKKIKRRSKKKMI